MPSFTSISYACCAIQSEATLGWMFFVFEDSYACSCGYASVFVLTLHYGSRDFDGITKTFMKVSNVFSLFPTNRVAKYKRYRNFLNRNLDINFWNSSFQKRKDGMILFNIFFKNLISPKASQKPAIKTFEIILKLSL